MYAMRCMPTQVKRCPKMDPKQGRVPVCVSELHAAALYKERYNTLQQASTSAHKEQSST